MRTHDLPYSPFVISKMHSGMFSLPMFWSVGHDGILDTGNCIHEVYVCTTQLVIVNCMQNRETVYIYLYIL